MILLGINGVFGAAFSEFTSDLYLCKINCEQSWLLLRSLHNMHCQGINFEYSLFNFD